MKRLLLITLMGIALFSLAFADAQKAGKQNLTLTDSITAVDTAAAATRLTIDTTDPIGIWDYSYITFVFTHVADTNFTDDTLRYILQYEIGGAWFTFDTLQRDLTSDTTFYGSYLQLDTLNPMDQIRFILSHWDVNETTAPGLLGNNYNYTTSIWFKGIK